MQTLFSTPYVTIYLHEGQAPMVELSWLGYTPSQHFREAVEQALDVVAQYQAKGWLSDDRYLGAVRPRDLEWAFDMAVPRLSAAGLLRLAQLESQDAMNRRTINGAYEQNEAALPFELRRFTDLIQARTWALGLAQPA